MLFFHSVYLVRLILPYLLSHAINNIMFVACKYQCYIMFDCTAEQAEREERERLVIEETERLKREEKERQNAEEEARFLQETNRLNGMLESQTEVLEKWKMDRRDTKQVCLEQRWSVHGWSMAVGLFSTFVVTSVSIVVIEYTISCTYNYYQYHFLIASVHNGNSKKWVHLCDCISCTIAI